jgi:NAD(P)-dependent dehydrogenase (short-subunit alcohol dehydrogenase family)
MSKRLENKVAIIVGAGSVGPGWGNGKAAAVLFAREGAKVFCVDINEDAAKVTKDIIDGEGGECTICKTDVSKEKHIKDMVKRCIEVYGKIDILYNNVGIVETGGPVETPVESWEKVMDVNLKSIFLSCKYVLPHMETQGSGSIINMSSLAAIRTTEMAYCSYNASKAGILGLTMGIAIQYAKKGIRANSILPGLLNTPMIIEPYKKVYGDDLDKIIDMRDKMTPTGKMGDAWDTAYAALFLASDESKYITGLQMIVDGGLSLYLAPAK